MLKRFKSWFVNIFWYHYKWHFLAVLFALLVTVAVISETVTRNKDDFKFIISTEGYCDLDMLFEMSLVFAMRHGDINGDGNANYTPEILLMDRTTKEGADNLQRMQLLFMTPSNCLFIFDEALMPQYETDEGFLPLGNEGFPVAEGKPWMVKLTGSPLMERAGLSDRVYYAVVRAYTGKDAEKYAQTQELSVDFLRMLLDEP